LAVVEKDEIKHLSAALLAGEPIGALTPECGFLISPKPVGQPFAHTLHLVPQDFVVGMGCRRGADGAALYQFLADTFAEKGWSLYRIRAIASIDVKAQEPGLLELAERLGVPLLTYSAKELAAQQGEFSTSEFVRSQVGVDNVCERSALCGAISEGWIPAGSRLEDFIRLRKCAGHGVTLAVLAIYMQS
jgi:cobalt-precorrin 5A hydrolase